MFLFTTIAELLKRCHGRYTDKQTERCSKITGSFGKDLDRVFNQVMFGLDREHTTRKKTSTYFRDINKFVTMYKADAPFSYCPPREHSAFSQFTDITSKIKHPGKLGQRLFAIGEEFDFWKRREARARQPQQD
jgi:hypothetical protein